MLDNILYTDRAVCQIIGHTCLGVSEVAAECTLTNIQIYYDDTLPGIHKAHGEVSGDKGFSGSFIERGKGNYLHGLLFLSHECHVGTQDAERF